MLIPHRHIFAFVLGSAGLFLVAVLVSNLLHPPAIQAALILIGTPTPLAPSSTPTRTSNSKPFGTATATFVSTRVSQPSSTPLPFQTIPPLFDLDSPNPTDAEALHLIFQDLYEHGIASDYSRQNIDVNNDGHLEIVIHGLARSDSEAYVAILMQVPDSTINGKPKWRVVTYESDGGHYCSASHATFERNLVIADYLTCGGGTGVFVQNWRQKWFKCERFECHLVLQVPVFWSSQSWNSSMYKGYMIARIETPDPETVLITRQRIQIVDVANAQGTPPDFVPMPSRKIVGPNEVITYKWDGSTFQLVQEQQTLNEIEITSEVGPRNDRAVDTIHKIIGDQSQYSQSGVIPTAQDNHEAAFDNFWGIYPNTPNILFPHQTQLALTVAAQDKQPGNRIATILASTNKVECRLNVQEVSSRLDSLWPLFQIDLPCVPNFTQLEWLDINGDKQDELLMLTLVNDVDGSAGSQRLHIFHVDQFSPEILRIEGEINGADGVGIKWELNDNGFDIYTGVAPSTLKCRSFSCISLERRWRHIHLDVGAKSDFQTP